MLILASGSKARKRLLEQAGIPHEILASGIDETNYNDSDIKKLVNKLAFAKADKVSSILLKNNCKEGLIKETKAILGCDSLFEFNGEILGKPTSHLEAIERLSLISSKSGYLHTGHALIIKDDFSSNRNYKNSSYVIQDVISTYIEFSDISKKEIEDYVKTGEPLNCAGGFSIDGKGALFINKINGCHSNVIGLSLPWLKRNLFKK